jgi:hypothetical protein
LLTCQLLRILKLSLMKKLLSNIILVKEASCLD